MPIRMAKFDLQKTATLAKLFTVPREQRDAAWIADFYAAAPDASLTTGDQQLIRGPDNFPYLAHYIPPPNQEFTSFCISQVLANCLEHGAGCVIAPAQSTPEWVFTYGNLWSLHSYGVFDATPAQVDDQAPTEAGRQVLVASPSETFLPAFARNVIKHFLTEAGIADPRVLLISDSTATPSQSLAFSVYPENFTKPDEFNDVMNRLKAWFLPPHYGLIALPKSSDYESHFVPL